MKNEKIILGVLAGLATGAILGILFSPESGANLRKRISKKSKAYSDEVIGKFNQILDNLSTKVEDKKEDIFSSIDNGKIKTKETHL